MRARSKAAIVVGALLISIVAEFPADVAEAQSAGSTPSINEPYAQCLQEVPYDVKVGSYLNFTDSGYYAKFSNGTEILYPDTSCVRPVYHDLYGSILAIGDNPQFISLENGSLYSFQTSATPNLFQNLTTILSSCSVFGSVTVPGGSVECLSNQMLNFFLYNGVILDGCGSPYPDFTGWIEVYLPVNSTTGELDFTNVLVHQNGAFGGVFMCTTTITDYESTTTSSTVSPTISQNGAPSTSALNRSDRANLDEVILVALIGGSCVVGVLVVMTLAQDKRSKRPAEGQ